VQDRLVREMRIQQIATLEQANRFLELTFWPFWQQRFTRQPTTAVNAHQTRTVAADHTVSWQGQRWGLWREDVCAGFTRGARGDRTASGRFALVALPRPLPAAA
jgi:hypothetical protein